MFHGWMKNFKSTCNFRNAKILIWMVCIKSFLNAQILRSKLIAYWRTHGGDADVNSWKWLKKWLGRRDGSVGGNLQYYAGWIVLSWHFSKKKSDASIFGLFPAYLHPLSAYFWSVLQSCLVESIPIFCRPLKPNLRSGYAPLVSWITAEAWELWCLRTPSTGFTTPGASLEL